MEKKRTCIKNFCFIIFGLCLVGSALLECKSRITVAKNSSESAVTTGSEYTVTPTPDPKETEGTEETAVGITIAKGKGYITTPCYDGSFITGSKGLYFKASSGKYIKKRFFTYKNNVYNAGKDGVITRGWLTRKGHYYFFSRKNGRLIMGKKSDGIKINKYGIAQETEYNVCKIKTFIDAKKVVNKVSSFKDSKADKLYKSFKWLEACGYIRYRTYKEAKVSYPDDWEIIFANDIFGTHNGCCVSESCALAFLAKECGYKNVTICCDTAHAWTDIEGRLYDPLFAESRSFEANYNAAYTDYRANPAIRKKV